MQTDICGNGYRGLCSKMDPVDGEVLLQYLLRVNFTGLCPFCIMSLILFSTILPGLTQQVVLFANIDEIHIQV